jgi:hypothetical protein
MTMAAPRSTAPFSRRGFVQGAGAATAGVFCGAGFLPAPASAANARDPRFVVIILRGALDGLSAIPPVGDPDYADLHGELAFASSGERAALKLDGFFSAHPALGVFKRMYDEKHAAVIHAAATGYRDRSHFDGQDVLESGYSGPGRTDSGWLNRTLGALPSSERRSRGLGVGQTAPLVIRGPATALGWAPPGGLAPAGADLAQRVLDLYAHRDPLLGQRLSEALAAQKVAAEGAMAQPTRLQGPGGRSTRCGPPQPEPHDSWPRRTDHASRRSPSTASTPIRTRAQPKACSPSGCRGSTPHSTPSRRTSAPRGGRRSSSRSPSSAARPASTEPTAPTMERPRSRSLRAAPSPAAGSSPTGRASSPSASIRAVTSRRPRI